MPEQEDKKELATNRLLEILRKNEAEGLEVEERQTIPEPEQEEIHEDIKVDKKDYLSQIREFVKNAKEKLNAAEQGIIGIDIGSYAIKAVYFRKQKDELILEDYKILQVDRKAPDSRQEIINNLFLLNIPENFLINSCVYGEKVLLKKVVVPKLSKKEQAAAIEWNAKKDISFPGESALVDFRIIEEFLDKGIEKISSLVALSDKPVIDDHLSVLSSANITPNNISTKPSALFNSYRHQFKGKELEDGIIIDIGATISYIIFVNEGQLQFARELKTGGDDINKGMEGSISTNTGIVKINDEIAEKLKKDYGIPEEGTSDMTPDGIPVAQVGFIIRPSLEKLLGQIQRSIDYYRNKFPYDEPGKVFLSGGTALLKNGLKFFSNGLEKEVEALNPFKNVFVDERRVKRDELDTIAPQLTVAAGSILTEYKRLNLLPQEIKEIPIRKRQFKYTIYAASFIVLLLLILSIMSVSSLSKLKRIYNETESTVLEADSKKVEFRRLILRKQSLQGEIVKFKNQILGVLGSKDIIGVLKILSSLTPDYIIINKIEVSIDEDKELNIHGTVKRQGYNNDVLLMGYMVELRKTGYFAEIEPYQDKTEDPRLKILQFELKCHL